MPTHAAAKLALLLSLTLACGPDGDDSGTSGGSTGTSTGTPTTGTPTTGTSTTDTTTAATDATSDVTSDATGDVTTDATTNATTDVTTAPTTGDLTTGDDTTTGVAGFDRFKLSRAAGPCAPDQDCDGFFELLADGTLRFEPFGEPGNPVIENLVSPEDLAAAIDVFADPALLALLGQDMPLCDPPTDILENMLVEIEGAGVEKATTTCEQPPLVAARAKVEELIFEYVP